ncbi:MAG: Cof-type HAD-IIB family hydrolase, partial [Firmicutes bacterium HGW-Firmicutes-13]
MSYKLLALDLDDTLLNEEFVISPGNKEAILEAARRGAAVTLATGRMFRSSLPYAEELGLDVPLITYHGAMVKKARSQEEIFHRPVPLDLAVELTNYLEAGGYHLNLYINDNLYVREDNELIQLYINIASVEFTAVGNLSNFIKDEPTKMTVIIKEENKLKDLGRLFNQKYGSILSVVRSRPYFLEITHAAATKGQALKYLAESMGIK